MEVNARGLFEMWTWMASLGFLAMLQQFVPREYMDSVRRNCRLWFQHFTPYIFCDIPEFENAVSNTLYQDVEAYISSLKVEGAQQLSLCKTRNSKAMTFVLSNNQRTFDTYDRAKVEWVHKVYSRNQPAWTNGWEGQSDEKRTYTLQIKKKDRDRVLDKYMAHIEARALELKMAARELLLYTNTKSGGYSFDRRRGPWQSVPFKHPANFDTLALSDEDLKARVIADLDKFSANENYYKRIGKAWKRGYLLYGPPGTGKSSMIAAIANKMRYDVYDLELTEVPSNAELRKLLLSTANKAVVVIEDIDCSLDLSGQRKKKKKEEPAATTTTTTTGTAAERSQPGKPSPDNNEQSKVTLSGLLNFVDGLWSCCGQERIFIFTTNYIEKLDPALLRAGRMDMHIHLSYCTFSAFKQLAKNYLEITEHELYPKLEAAFEGTYITPATVSEVLILNQCEEVDVVLEKVIEALDEHRVDPATIKKPEDEEEESSTTAEDPKGATERPPSPEVPQDKQQVVETSSASPQPSTDSTAAAAAAEKVELTLPQKIELTTENTDSPKKEPQSDKDLGELVKEIPETTAKTVAVTSKETTSETQSAEQTSAGQLQAV
ncbi:unnamed protein product [Calypogeia fissa]